MAHPEPHQPRTDHPYHPDRLTWAVLLGRWVEFARSALALPDTPQARALRDAVPDIIMLQAVCFALQNLNELEPDERALGLDRAEILIDKHARALHHRFPPETLPPQLHDLIRDARNHFASAHPPQDR